MILQSLSPELDGSVADRRAVYLAGTCRSVGRGVAYWLLPTRFYRPAQGVQVLDKVQDQGTEIIDLNDGGLLEFRLLREVIRATLSTAMGQSIATLLTLQGVLIIVVMWPGQ